MILDDFGGTMRSSWQKYGVFLFWLCLLYPASLQARGGKAASLNYEVNDAFCSALEQSAQEFLIRGHFRTDCESAVECRERHAASIKYRTEKYGRFPGYGKGKWNARPPGYYAQKTSFMGLKVTLNQYVVAALKCAERKIEKSCQECKPDKRYPNECKKTFPYKPRRTSGIRYKNTFRGGEVSNHVYGIAIDFDPTKNTCCGCVASWRNHPLCKKDLELYERMIMPMCWVHIFEEYGFYWLGRDKLRDTMHFEFLGRPELIEEAVAAQNKSKANP